MSYAARMALCAGILALAVNIACMAFGVHWYVFLPIDLLIGLSFVFAR